MRDKVRQPLGKLMLAGVIAASPVVGISAWAGDKLLRNIPVVEKVYDIPRTPIVKIAAGTRNAITATITVPAVVPDIARNVGQGFANIPTKEARGIVGSAVEGVSEKVGAVARFGFEKGPTALKKTGEVIGAIVASPFKLVFSVENGINEAVKAVPIIGKLGHVISIPLTLFGGHWALSNALPLISTTMAGHYQTFIQGLVSVLGGSVL